MSAKDSHISSTEILRERHEGIDVIDEDVASPEGTPTLVLALALLALDLLLGDEDF